VSRLDNFAAAFTTMMMKRTASDWPAARYCTYLISNCSKALRIFLICVKHTLLFIG
jgi:hypothetical protein